MRDDVPHRGAAGENLGACELGLWIMSCWSGDGLSVTEVSLLFPPPREGAG